MRTLDLNQMCLELIFRDANVSNEEKLRFSERHPAEKLEKDIGH